MIGVSSSCEASDTNARWRSRLSCRSAASTSAVAIACWRRRTWNTTARNISDISGTSVSSAGSSRPAKMASSVIRPVLAVTQATAAITRLVRQARNPYRIVKLT